MYIVFVITNVSFFRIFDTFVYLISKYLLPLLETLKVCSLLDDLPYVFVSVVSKLQNHELILNLRQTLFIGVNLYYKQSV